MGAAAKATILERLRDLEREHAITVLYACESGSRCWGFPSADSDWDVRFIYKHARERYLSLDEPQQQIESMGESEWGKLDIVGWDVKKALGLLRKSNPAMLEWVHSPLPCIERAPFSADLRALMIRAFNPAASAFHYANLARSDIARVLTPNEVILKRYFYMLRALLALEWIAADKGIPPILFEDLLKLVDRESVIYGEIESLLKRKRVGTELGRGPRVPVLHEYLTQAAARMDNQIAKAKLLSATDRPTNDEVNRFFRDTVES